MIEQRLSDDVSIELRYDRWVGARYWLRLRRKKFVERGGDRAATRLNTHAGTGFRDYTARGGFGLEADQPHE